MTSTPMSARLPPGATCPRCEHPDCLYPGEKFCLNQQLKRQEAALATLTMENAELKTRNDALESDLDFLANHMTTDWTNRTDVGGKAMLRMKAALDQATEPATPTAPTCRCGSSATGYHLDTCPAFAVTPPAPLPGGLGPTEAFRDELCKALRSVAGDYWETAFRRLADRLERAGAPLGSAAPAPAPAPPPAASPSTACPYPRCALPLGHDGMHKGLVKVAPSEPAGPKDYSTDPRLADALAHPPGPRHARQVEQAGNTGHSAHLPTIDKKST